MTCHLVSAATAKRDVETWQGPLGWFWWQCEPGGFPSTDPCGPFISQTEAVADARAALED